MNPRSPYNSAFPASMTPAEIDAYRASAGAQSRKILAEIAQRAAERKAAEEAECAAALQHAWRQAIEPQAAYCEAILDYSEAPAPPDRGVTP